MRAKLLATACAAAQMALCLPAFGQTSEDRATRGDDSGDIIVTATRREERLQDVPLSITAFSQEELTERGIVGYEGLAMESPGIVLNRASANFNNFTARGISTNGYGANLQSTVAIYIDELPISSNGNSTILNPNLYDVERIEFLRGPQGTLFGSGSLAGALRIITHAPDLNQFDASALVDLGMTDGDSLRQRYNGMVNIPLVQDRMALRIVGFMRDEEGYIDNIGTGINNANTLENYGARAVLRVDPTDRLSLRFLASYENSDPQDSSTVNPALGRDVRRSDRPDRFSGELTNYNLTGIYQFDGASLTSSSTWTEFDALFYVDLAGTFGQAIAFALDADAWDDAFVQEMRLVSDPGGRWDWVIGGFYFQKRRTVDFNYRSSPAFLAARGITGLPDEYYQRFRAYTDMHEMAGFGELTYRFTDDFWATGGVRYGSTDAQSFTVAGGYNSNYLINALFFIPGPLTITPIPAATGLKAEETGPSYRFSLSWRPTPSLTTYAAVATGFRTPVVNARAGAVSTLNPNDIIIPFGADSDELINYELGLKGRWLDGRLSANIALYHIDWNNIQVQANRVSDSVQFATNIGGATSNGVEFEVWAVPFDGLTLGFTGALNEAKVDSLTPLEAAISGAVLGSRLSGPRVQAAISANYRWYVGDTTQANFSIVAQHVGAFPGMFPNTPGQPNVPNPLYGETQAFTLVNSTFALTFDHFTVGAYVENLFNDRSIAYVHPEAFIDGRFATVRPRTVGVRIGYQY